MKYLLDTNTCIRHLNQRSEAITRRLIDTPEAEIGVCSVVVAELYFGAMKSQNPARTLLSQQAFIVRFTSLPFDDTSAMTYAQVRATLERNGTPISANDLMIASIALANDLTLVTHNTREFSRVADLRLEDWELDHH